MSEADRAVRGPSSLKVVPECLGTARSDVSLFILLLMCIFVLVLLPTLGTTSMGEKLCLYLYKYLNKKLIKNTLKKITTIISVC